MAKVAEAYIHLRPYGLDRERVNVLGDRALEIAIKAAQEVYGGDVAIELILEEGSAKFWAKVSAVFFAAHFAYGTIADWKAFKEQVTEWVNEARQFGDKVIGEIVKETGAKPSQVYRTERRLKAPGKLRRLIEQLEDLNEVSRTMPRAQIVRQMEQIVVRELEALKAELTREEMKRLFQELKFENLPPLNELPREKPIDPMPKVGMRVDQNQRHREMDLGYFIGTGTEPPSREPHRKLVYRKQIYVAAVGTQEEEKNRPIQDLWNKGRT